MARRNKAWVPSASSFSPSPLVLLPLDIFLPASLKLTEKGEARRYMKNQEEEQRRKEWVEFREGEEEKEMRRKKEDKGLTLSLEHNDLHGPVLLSLSIPKAFVLRPQTTDIFR